MSIQDAARVAVDLWDGRTVGGVDLPTVMVAIAGAESGWKNNNAGDSQVTSVNKCNGYASWGLWQINMASGSERAKLLRTLTGSDSPCAWADWLSVPANNGRVASILIGDAQEYPISALRPWTVWFSQDGNPDHDAGDGNGGYRRHLAAAEAAIAAVKGDPQQPAPSQPGSALVALKPILVGVTTSLVFLGLFALAAMAVGVEEVEGTV